MEQDQDIKPTKAYDLLTPAEREAVDTYLAYVISNQQQRGERIALALQYPIPTAYLRQSRGLLAKPVPRAALAERIQEEADQQDLSPKRVIEEYRRIAYASPEDFFEMGHFGDLQLRPMEQIPTELWSAVKTVEINPTLNGLRTKLQFYDKQTALDKFTKLMGMVAADRPPVLEDYVKPVEDRGVLDAPEEVYAQMLED